MDDAFVGEIRIFAGDFAPRNWAFCNGQRIDIQDNSALYSVLGLTYGGIEKSYFLLPNLNDRVPLHSGKGDGLTLRKLGAVGGFESVTLDHSSMPSHSHSPQAFAGTGESHVPNSNVAAEYIIAGRTEEPKPLYSATPSDSRMNRDAIGSIGGNQPHNNMQPYLAMNYIICIIGRFPTRN